MICGRRDYFPSLQLTLITKFMWIMKHNNNNINLLSKIRFTHTHVRTLRILSKLLSENK